MSIKRYDVGMTEETNNRTGFYASYPRVYEAEKGRYVEYADYARLKAEVSMLEGRVRYWRIEAECDHGRWLRCLEDLEHLRNLK